MNAIFWVVLCTGSYQAASAFGVITANESSSFSAVDASLTGSSSSASICVLYDVVENECFEQWSAPAQTITSNGARAMDIVTTPNETFLSIANYHNGETTNSYSDVYRWLPHLGGFELHQKLRTFGALDVEAFQIGDHRLLAVANVRNQTNGAEYVLNSTVYRWEQSSNLFRPFQQILTAGGFGWKYFTIGAQKFLVAANYVSGTSYVVNSTIYRWNAAFEKFEYFQNISTVGAVNAEAFSHAGETFLAIANHYTGASYNADSVIYRWKPVEERFVEFQTIQTCGARQWYGFTVGNNISFLAVANSRPSASCPSSVIYEWNNATGNFQVYQNLTATGIVRYRAFEMGNLHFLAAARYPLVNYDVNSVLYVWHEASGHFSVYQSPATQGASDWKAFNVGSAAYLAVANQRSLAVVNATDAPCNSYIFRLPTVHSLSISETTLEMYVAWGRTLQTPCFFNADSVTAHERYAYAVNKGYRFGLRIFASNTSTWYDCEPNTSGIRYYKTTDSITACPSSGIVLCDIAHVPITPTSEWKGAVQLTYPAWNITHEIVASNWNAYRITDHPLGLLSFGFTQVGTLFHANLVGRGWRRLSASVPVSAFVNGTVPCSIPAENITDRLLTVICPGFVHQVSFRLTCGGQTLRLTLPALDIPSPSRTTTASTTVTPTTTATATVSASVAATVAPSRKPPLIPQQSIYNTTTVLAHTPIGLGCYHGCVISLEGRLECWGDNSYGQGGLPSNVFYTMHKRAVHLAAQPVMQLVVGCSYTCALNSDNEVHCFGWVMGQSAFLNADGQSQLRFADVANLSFNSTHTCMHGILGRTFCFVSGLG